MLCVHILENEVIQHFVFSELKNKAFGKKWKLEKQ